MNHKVSIIMPTYNSEMFIRETICSVLNQTYHDFELLICDDCSNDNTTKILNNFKKSDNRIKVFLNKTNLGPAVARNVCIKNATGRYIAFLDSDDIWNVNKLSVQINFMRNHNVAFTYSPFDIINESGNFVKHVIVPDSINYTGLLKSQVIGCLTAVYDTNYFDKVYMPEIKRRQDFALWLKLLKLVPNAYSVSQSLCSYRVSSHSLSSNKFKAIFYTWLVYYKIEKINIFFCVFYFSSYLVHSFKRYFRIFI